MNWVHFFSISIPNCLLLRSVFFSLFLAFFICLYIFIYFIAQGGIVALKKCLRPRRRRDMIFSVQFFFNRGKSDKHSRLSNFTAVIKLKGFLTENYDYCIVILRNLVSK